MEQATGGQGVHQDEPQPDGTTVLEAVDQRDSGLGDDELDEVVGGLTPGWNPCTSTSCPEV